MLANSTGQGGTLDTDKFLVPQVTGLSSSQIVFGKKIKYLRPFAPGMRHISSKWHKVMKQRELVMARRQQVRGQEMSEHYLKLVSLKIKDTVCVHNQDNDAPNGWGPHKIGGGDRRV